MLWVVGERKLAGLNMYGTASSNKHSNLIEYGAIPIDYKTQDFVEVLQDTEPDGIDYVFNGMDRDYNNPVMRVLRPSGMLVQYGAPERKLSLVRLLIDFALSKLLPRGKSLELYGTHRISIESRKQDWKTLFRLLEERKIKPVISQRFPLLEAANANELLESGQITGNVVLLVP